MALIAGKLLYSLATMLFSLGVYNFCLIECLVSQVCSAKCNKVTFLFIGEICQFVF